jgi:threonine/homoserine/homoserine lactone efflux protein
MCCWLGAKSSGVEQAKNERQMLIGLLKILIGGFCVGLASSVTVGPVAVLCIQRTLSKGYLSGIASGLGVAVADTSLAILAFSVFALIKSYIDEYSTIIQICGGAIVIIIGVFIFFQNPVPQIRKNRAGMRDLWQDFASMFGVTLANFVVIIPYILAFFTMFNIDISMSPDALSMSRLVQNMFVILGFLLGAMTWWLSITSLINIFRKRFRPRHMLTINHVAGIVISVLGLITLLSTIIK